MLGCPTCLARPGRRYRRHITDACKIPNAPMRTLASGPGGVSCMAFSHGGTYLATAVCMSQGKGQAIRDNFKIVVYKVRSHTAKESTDYKRVCVEEEAQAQCARCVHMQACMVVV